MRPCLAAGPARCDRPRPRHCPLVVTTLVPALFRLLSRWPLWALHGLGWCLGWLSFLASARYRRRLWSHARLAGVPWPRILRSVGHAGRMLAELPRLWFGRPVACHWDGEAWIAAALDEGRGIVFLTPHMGSFEVTAQAYAHRFGARRPITVLFRPPRQPWLRELVARARRRPGLLTAPTTLAGVRQMIKALKAGEAVGLLPDQVPPDGMGVWVPFFGRDAYTMTLAGRLVQASGAVPLLAWGERLPAGRGFVIHVRPFEGGVLSTDPVEGARQVNQAMERVIAECPEQYLWSYNRYKPPA
jgi:KDO2-lipid IV(A) lauroyltransferase